MEICIRSITNLRYNNLKTNIRFAVIIIYVVQIWIDYDHDRLHSKPFITVALKRITTRMKVLLVVLLILPAVLAHTTPSPGPAPDCTRYHKLLFNPGKCFKEGKYPDFLPCEAGKTTKQAWRSKCGRAWRKLEKYSRRYSNCQNPQQICQGSA